MLLLDSKFFSASFAGFFYHFYYVFRWLFTLKGRGLITLPLTKETLELGPGSVLIATDTPDVSTVGHHTEWLPGSVAVQQPFKNGQAPPHQAIHEGVCTEDELEGVREITDSSSGREDRGHPGVSSLCFFGECTRL